MASLAAAFAAARISSAADMVSIQARWAPPSIKTRDLLGENLLGLVLGEAAERRKKIARRSHRARDDDRSRCFRCDFTRKTRRLWLSSRARLCKSWEHQPARVAAEAVREDDVGPRIDEALMQRHDTVGMGSSHSSGASPETSPISNRLVPVAPSARRKGRSASRSSSKRTPFSRMAMNSRAMSSQSLRRCQGRSACAAGCEKRRREPP